MPPGTAVYIGQFQEIANHAPCLRRLFGQYKNLLIILKGPGLAGQIRHLKTILETLGIEKNQYQIITTPETGGEQLWLHEIKPILLGENRIFTNSNAIAELLQQRSHRVIVMR